MHADHPPIEPFAAVRARPAKRLQGETLAPGDKSISHRAILFAAMAQGESRIEALLEGEDVLRTAAAMRAFGADIERERRDGAAPVWRVRGASWSSPERALYFGNAGTGCRLVMGAAAGRGVAARFEGDASLRRRPMERILEPLRLMGAQAASADGRLPVTLEGGRRLHGVDYAPPTASAQVKSAVLLAGLGASGQTIVRERLASRDHTERMLKAFGAEVAVEAAGESRVIRLAGGQSLRGADIVVPGDPSSAAFIVAAAVVVPQSEVLVRGVLVNPLRIGFYETLREMGADIAFENMRTVAGEPVADIRARSSALHGVETPAARAPSMIDEYPILSVVAAFARGATFMRGVGDLRVKESDRLAAVEAGLNANGVGVETGPDWIRVDGAGAARGGGHVLTRLDHRIAMSFLVLGLAARESVSIDDAAMIATSFPTFISQMTAIGAAIEGKA